MQLTAIVGASLVTAGAIPGAIPIIGAMLFGKAVIREIKEAFDTMQDGVYNQSAVYTLKSNDQPDGSGEDSDTSDSLLARFFKGYNDYSSAAAGFNDGLMGTEGSIHTNDEAYLKGKIAGDIGRLLGITGTAAYALTEILLGGATIIGGGGLTISGAGAIAGIPAIAGGIALATAGVVVIEAAIRFGSIAFSDFQNDWDAYQDAREASMKEPMGKNKGSAPRNNQAQNKQVRDVETELGLSKEEVRILHDEISGQGYNYNEILELAKSLFGK